MKRTGEGLYGLSLRMQNVHADLAQKLFLPRKKRVYQVKGEARKPNPRMIGNVILVVNEWCQHLKMRPATMEEGLNKFKKKVK